MTLRELKKHIDKFPDGTVFGYSLSYPFSWRGNYSDVAFTIVQENSTKEDTLKMVNAALNDTFEGYKGGDYSYSGSTDVHFERDDSAYSDGEYTEEWIAKILNLDYSRTPEQRLINLLFN